MNVSLLNTPMQASALSTLYGAPLEAPFVLLVVGDEEHTKKWLPMHKKSRIYALRKWDVEKMNSVSEYSGLYIQEPPDIDWSLIVSQIKARSHCMIRHGLPIGTLLKQAQEKIPAEYIAMLSKKSPYGSTMNRVRAQKLPHNPISLFELCRLMREKGWYYVCDLCTYRDFGHEYTDIRAMDALCGLVWRDSLFVRKDPFWSTYKGMFSNIQWRIYEKKRVPQGWIYTTPEGLQLGVRGSFALDSYIDWDTLFEAHQDQLHSLIHSGLLHVQGVQS